MVMRGDPTSRMAASLRVSVGMLRRRQRQAAPIRTDAAGELSPGPARALRPGHFWRARQVEQIRPQSMGATLAALEARGLIARQPDPADGRRVVLSVTEAGLELLRNKRGARTEQLAQALSAGFTAAELRQLAAAAPLLERLAQSI